MCDWSEQENSRTFHHQAEKCFLIYFFKKILRWPQAMHRQISIYLRTLYYAGSLSFSYLLADAALAGRLAEHFLQDVHIHTELTLTAPQGGVLPHQDQHLLWQLAEPSINLHVLLNGQPGRLRDLLVHQVLHFCRHGRHVALHLLLQPFDREQEENANNSAIVYLIILKACEHICFCKFIFSCDLALCPSMWKEKAQNFVLLPHLSECHFLFFS